MRMTFIAILLLVGSLLAAPAQAQQVPLKDQQVRAFLASYPEMKQLGDANREEMKKGPPPDPTKPFASTLQFMETSAAREQFVAVTQRYGFTSLAEWIDVAGRVVRAYVAITSAQHLDQMQAELARARRDVATDVNMSASQKAIINEQLDNTEKLVKAYSSNPGDKAVIQPYLQQVAKIVPAQ